jgi:hypothetical protein
MTANPCTDFNLDALMLKDGAHGCEFGGEACILEYANVLAACRPELREKFGAVDFTDDHPSVSRVIRSFCISFNDGIKDDQRRTDLLKPYAVKILGTKTNDADEETRAWMATDWLVRVQTPAWLDLAGLSSEIARGVQDVLDGARDDAAAARDAARAAAREKLRPTVETLQASAIELLDRMCALDSRTAKAA